MRRSHRRSRSHRENRNDRTHTSYKKRSDRTERCEENGGNRHRGYGEAEQAPLRVDPEGGTATAPPEGGRMLPSIQEMWVAPLEG